MRQVEEAGVRGLQRLVLFGSVARETHRPDSAIDILAVMDDDSDERAVEDRLRAIAYDVALEYGAVFSIHGVTESTFEDRSDRPFFGRLTSSRA